MTRIVLAILMGMCWGGWTQEALPPLPSAMADPRIDTFGDASTAAWIPMRITDPASVVQVNGRNALRLACAFQSKDLPRASWDRKVNAQALDLATAQGIQFLMYCHDTSPVLHFNVYFRSGAGWYGAELSNITPGKWNCVTVRKTDVWPEGTPGAWGQIDTFRISAWRLKQQDTTFYIADLAILDNKADIMLIRGDSAAQKAPGEAGAVKRHAETTARFLGELGIPYGILGDQDLTPARLNSIKLVILPYNPAVSEAMEQALLAFVRGGGKIISFYALPNRLAAAVGFSQGQYRRAERPGQFASMRASGTALPGLPAVVKQASRNIQTMGTVPGRSQIIARWHDNTGASTGQAALLMSGQAIHMTHVLLPDDPANKRRMLMAMIGHCMPDHWRNAAQRAVADAGVIGPYTTFEAAHKAIGAQVSRNRTARQALTNAGESHTRALSLLTQRSFPEAIEAAHQAREQLVYAYCAVQRPQRNEFRAFWCHSAFGVDGMEWDAAIRTLAENGFTAILPNMLWGGVAYYDSQVLPVASAVHEKGDQIAACLAACKRYGVACHVWKVCWNMAHQAPASFIAKMKHAGRTQVKFDGTREDQWLCPSHPANQQLEIDAMLEVARKYDVDGIHFDYIRYPGQESCFCAGCRNRFEQVLGKSVGNWPGDVRSNEAMATKWQDFRRAQITHVVRAVSQAVRATKPRMQISAAVFPNLPVNRDSVAQDWGLWCEQGYLDFVCPMDYMGNNAQFESVVREQVTWSGRVPCYPGIGLSVWPDAGNVLKLIDQINMTRQCGTGGFTVFNYAVSEARDVVPMCGVGITRK